MWMQNKSEKWISTEEKAKKQVPKIVDVAIQKVDENI